MKKMYYICLYAFCTIFFSGCLKKKIQDPLEKTADLQVNNENNDFIIINKNHLPVSDFVFPPFIDQEVQYFQAAHIAVVEFFLPHDQPKQAAALMKDLYTHHGWISTDIAESSFYYSFSASKPQKTLYFVCFVQKNGVFCHIGITNDNN